MQFTATHLLFIGLVLSLDYPWLLWVCLGTKKRRDKLNREEEEVEKAKVGGGGGGGWKGKMFCLV